MFLISILKIGGLKLKGKICPIAKLPHELRYTLLKGNFDTYQGTN